MAEDPSPRAKRWRNTPRLKGLAYDGDHAYHVVFNTSHQRPLLVEELAKRVADALAGAARTTHHELLAYVVMPNHVHALVQGQRPDTDAVRFVGVAKQGPGYWYRQRTREYLWLPGFYDRIVRRGDDAREIATYIVNNPVRAGLISHGDAWPYRGGTLVEPEIGRG